MAKATNQTRTCADCFHCKACHMWSSGAISDTVASKCQQFEPVRYASLKELQDLYKMHKGEVVPVRHGRWGRELRGVVRCSYCDKGYRITNGGANVLNFAYCPNCGAKMDGGAGV